MVREIAMASGFEARTRILIRSLVLANRHALYVRSRLYNLVGSTPAKSSVREFS